MKPLFIPLKAEFYDAFERGDKDTEYRLRGPRWNAETCSIGRAVILSRGYGKKRRLHGKIAGFCYDTIPSKIPGWTRCYGNRAGDAVCIKIALPCPKCLGVPVRPEIPECRGCIECDFTGTRKGFKHAQRMLDEALEVEVSE